MKDTFSLNRQNIIINFSKFYTNSGVELLESSCFISFIENFISSNKERQHLLFKRIDLDIENVSDYDNAMYITNLFRLIYVFDLDYIELNHPIYIKNIKNQKALVHFIEELYTYWRKFERYAVIEVDQNSSNGLDRTFFIEAHNRFMNVVLETYRRIEETVIGKQHNVYRQLIAGVNAGIIISQRNLKIPYEQIAKVDVIEKVILHPPFITYPKKNTRSGIFKEVFTNPLDDFIMDDKSFFCFPVKVGQFLALFYFHKDFMSQGITLSNLFELATIDEINENKIDFVYIYGANDGDKKDVFYEDKENDILVGYVSYSDDFDYFGYVKKMLLTLHNIKLLNQSKLPIHGGMARVTLTNHKTYNIILIGDSGAGKSETLEALKTFSDSILELDIIFDDMGSISFEDGKLVARGSEIGAFVRLDDLDEGYAYRQIDRSIFMNPDKVNSRIVLPISSYELVTSPHHIDYIFYANNYEDFDGSIRFFEDAVTALPVFIKGARQAKGTTSEIGITESFFANPFGPVQRYEQTMPVLETYFDLLFSNKIIVGEIFTRLGVVGHEHNGPVLAAKTLVQLFEK